MHVQYATGTALCCYRMCKNIHCPQQFWGQKVDYQTLAITECLVKNLISTWLFFITWNQLFAALGMISSVLLTMPRQLLLAKEMSPFSPCSLPATHPDGQGIPPSFTVSSSVCCCVSARSRESSQWCWKVNFAVLWKTLGPAAKVKTSD